MKRTTKDLSEQQIKELKSWLISMPIGSFIFACLFGYNLYYIYNTIFVLKQSWQNNIFWIITLPIAGFVPFYILFLLKDARKDFKLGQSEYLTGILTKKSNSLVSSGRYEHYFHFDDQIISLGKHNHDNPYKEISVGQNVGIERFVHSKTVINVEVLHQN